MRKTKYVPRPKIETPRKKWLRFRVNDEEDAAVRALAEQAGFGTVSDYLRALVNLPALHPGAPIGNINARKKEN